MKPITRRHLMQTAGAALATAIPYRAFGAGPAISPLMTTLSNYMAEAAKRPLPAPAVEKTKQIILDTIAAMVSGAELPPGKFAINFARAYKGEKVLGAATTAKLIERIFDLENVKNVRDLRPLLQKA